jgi:hypothetical protein
MVNFWVGGLGGGCMSVAGRAGVQSLMLCALPIGWQWVVDQIEIGACRGVVVTYT